MNRRSLILAAAGALLVPRPGRAWQKHSGIPVATRLYFELTTTHVYTSGFNSGYTAIGIAGAGASLNNAGSWNSGASQPAMAELVGTVRADNSGGGIGYPVKHPGISVQPTLGVYACAVNVTAKLMWLRDVTEAATWIGSTTGGDPATDSLGFDYSGQITGVIYAFGGVTQRNDTNYAEAVLNFGGSAFSGTVPTGYVAWGASDTLNPSDKSSVIVLSGGNLTLSSIGAGDLNIVGQLARSIGTHP